MGLSSWILVGGLALWGWSIGQIPLALLLALPLAGTRVVKRRLALGPAEFHRTLDIAWVLFFGGLLLTYNREPVGSVLRSFARWLPVVAFPAVLAQSWAANHRRIPVTSLIPLPFWRKSPDRARREVDVTGVFLAVCVLSASVAAGHRPWFYVGLCAVVGTALWVSRRREGSRLAGAVLLGGALVTGWWQAVAIGEFQGWLENRVLQWATRWRRDEGPLRSSRTAIGSKGRVEGSSRVILTVAGESGDLPRRLRVAAYSTWYQSEWRGTVQGPEKIEGTLDEWQLDPRPGRTGAVRVELRRDATGGLLALPAETRVIGELPAESVEVVRLGAVRAEMRPSVISYRADLGEDARWEAPPTEEDRMGVPKDERPALEAVLDDLRLANHPADEVTRRLGAFFQREFRYSTDLSDPPAADPRATTPIGRFLLGHRTGHCEYFATASVLLLRAAGVPARYATGYSVNPLDVTDGVHRVRERYAHAWVRVWTGERWHDFDPTPTVLEEAANSTGAWGRVWSDLWFAVSRWWWLGEKRLLRQAYWLTLPLLGGLIWRLRRLRSARGPKGAPHRSASRPIWPGLDSEWFAVEARLSELGWPRRPGEPLRDWLERMDGPASRDGMRDRLATGGLWHQRLRFDPRGLEPGERGRLREVSARLLEELPRSR